MEYNEKEGGKKVKKRGGERKGWEGIEKGEKEVRGERTGWEGRERGGRGEKGVGGKEYRRGIGNCRERGVVNSDDRYQFHLQSTFQSQ